MLIDVRCPASERAQAKEHQLPNPRPGALMSSAYRRRESAVDFTDPSLRQVIDMIGFHARPVTNIPAGHSVVLGGVVCLARIGEQFIHDEMGNG